MKNLLLLWISKLTKKVEGLGLGKIKPLYLAYTKILSFVRPDRVIVFGNTIILDKEDSLLLSIYPTFEPEATALIKKVVKKGTTVVDIGAHIGYFTVLLAKLVGPKGRVYAFEPSKENFEILKQNIEVNGYKNVVLENAAISNKVGKTKLFLSSYNSQDNRILRDAKEVRKFVLTKTYSLDNYFKRVKVDFMKIDIQGAEPLAFECGKKLIARSSKIKIVFEYWPYMFQMSKLGFNFYKNLSRLGKIKLIGSRGKLSEFKYKKLENPSVNYVKQLYFEKTK